MKLTYNSPIILTFTLMAVIVMILSNWLGDAVVQYFLLIPQAGFGDPLTYLRLFTHTLGHGNWEHLVGNFALILLVGPMVEEKYGSPKLLLMILFTAAFTGVLHILFFPESLLGASGIVFMLILLSSFANFRAGTIPLTFILVALIYIGKEVAAAFGEDNISQFAHIIGGICGGIFGFLLTGKERNAQPPSKTATPSTPVIPPVTPKSDVKP